MTKHWLVAAAIGTMLAAAPALAQTATAQLKPGDFLTQEKPDQWRASKLSGVAVYGDNNKKIGSITDILLGHDGKAEYIIIGVGGFLGIGTKDVAVPFDAVKFTDQPINPPPPLPPAATAPLGAAPGTATNAPALGAPASPAPMANPPPPPTAYPDHGMLATTKDELKGAPSFHFAR